MPDPFWLIGLGPNADPLDVELSRFVSEIRVEEELSKATRFAVRFEETLCAGGLEASGADALQPGALVTILVKEKDEDDQLAVLVHGPITKIKTSAVIADDENWYEIHGEDQRVLLARENIETEYVGYASDAVEALLTALGYPAEVDQTSIYYDDDRKLTHAGDALAFVEKVARDNILEFWLDYARTTPGAPVAPTFNVKASPPRPALSAGGVPPPPAPPSLPILSAGDGAPTLLVNATARECANVLSFSLDVDVERASAILYQTVADDGAVEDGEAVDAQPATEEGGDALADVDGVRRAVARPVEGDPAEIALRARAEATEAGWFVTAEASLAIFATRFLPRPHLVVAVEGLGERHSGAYQIFEAVHVLNGAGVLSDVKLRRNAINTPAPAATGLAAAAAAAAGG